MSEALREALARAAPGRRRHDLTALWAAFAAAHPADAEGPDARRTLRKLLDRLSDAGTLQLPKGPGNWDQAAHPALPRFVTLCEEPRAVEASLPDPAWAPELRFAREVKGRDQREVLRIVQRFLAEGGRDRPLVPERERSLSLFGDEKRLEQLRRTQLFAPGRLSLELLRCFSVSPPLVWERFKADVADAIVLENHHTYHSFCRYAAQRGRYVAVVYGAGNALCRSVESLSQVATQAGVKKLEYFGDLDAAGLRVARKASELSHEGCGLPLSPSPFYADLVRFAPRPGLRQRAAAEDVEWLPEALRKQVLDATEQGLRWPQEFIGTEFLLG